MVKIRGLLRRILRGFPHIHGKGRFVQFGAPLLGRPELPTSVRLVNGARMVFREGIDDQFWYMRIRDPEITYYLMRALARLSPDVSVVDVGANEGYYTLLTAQHLSSVGNGKVYAFEPHPVVIENLRANVNLNPFQNIVIEQKALSSESGIVDFFVSHRSSVFSSLKVVSPDLDQRLQVEAITLDSYFSARPDEKVGLIKMDIQGAELWALQGCASILERDHPILILEEWPYGFQVYGYSVKELKQFLKKFGYRFYIIDKGFFTWSVLRPVGDDADCKLGLDDFTNLLCVVESGV
jgi:FkbM family methyltransferase